MLKNMIFHFSSERDVEKFLLRKLFGNWEDQLDREKLIDLVTSFWQKIGYWGMVEVDRRILKYLEVRRQILEYPDVDWQVLEMIGV